MDIFNNDLDPSRRVFIKGLGFVSLGLITGTLFGGCESILEQIRNRPVRRRLRSGSSEVDNDIAIYREAVNQMKALPASDPRSWSAQAALHGTVSGGFNFCEHGTTHFFSWHRAYLLYFERICQQLTGEAKFGLPYWNWNQNQAIHSAFLDSSSPLYDGTRVNTTVWDSGAFVDEFLNPIFEDNNFYTFSDQIEGTPHNSAHSIIGGNMVTGGSPLDPVFWTHHCMVDYCWAKWNIELENDNTNDSGWLTTSWDHFVDGNGDPVEVSAGITTLMPLLSYRYEPSTVGRFTGGLSLTALSRSDFEKLRKRIEKGVEVRYEIRKKVPISTQAKAFIEKPLSVQTKLSRDDLSALLDTDPKRERVFLQVNYATLPPNNDFLVRAFVNLPSANAATPIKSPHYAGTFAFFGTHHDGDEGKHHHKTQFLINTTETLKRLNRSGKLRAGEPVSVQLVTVPTGKSFAAPRAPLVLNRVEFIVSPVGIGPRQQQDK